MRLVLSLLLFPFLASCSVIPGGWYEDSRVIREFDMSAFSHSLLPPPPPKILTGSETIYQNNYVLNETMAAKVGETVLRVQAFHQDNYINQAFFLEKPVTAIVEKAQIELPAGQYTIVGMFERDGESFFVLPQKKHHYFLVNAYGEFQPLYLYGVRNSNKVSIFPDKAKFSPSSVRMKRVTSFERPKLPFSDFEVVYEGIQNNQIKLFYKNAVPGTNGGSGGFDTLFYPVDSTLISIEGRLLRILQVTGEQIVFVVVRD